MQDYGTYHLGGTAKAQTRLCICAVSPEPLLFAYTKNVRRGRLRQKKKPPSPLDMYASTCYWFCPSQHIFSHAFFLGWPSTKQRKKFLTQNTTQCLQWGLNQEAWISSGALMHWANALPSYASLTNYIPADILCKQIGPRGFTSIMLKPICLTLRWYFLKNFLKKLILKKIIADDEWAWKISQGAKS